MLKHVVVGGARLALAGLLLAPIACADSLDSEDDTFRKAHIDLDIGVNGATGILMEDVELRPGVTVDLFVNVIGKIDNHCQLAVHGGVFAAESWRPYAEELGKHGCVLAPDMPVRGNSGVPDGAQFADLDLFDYVTAIEEILERLDELGIEPRTILGHSMGGTIVQMLQQRLIDEGSNLRERYGIRDAILVASDLPAEVPWALGDSGDLSGLLAAFAVDEPDYGLLFEIPVELWPAFYFTNRLGELAPDSPTPAEVEAAGYNALGEPLRAIEQLNGTGDYAARPSADAGLFADCNGTRLRVIAYENDIYVQLDESETLYHHLTGDAGTGCYVPVYGPDTVHTMQFSNPDKLVDAIAGAHNCHY